MIEKLKKFKNLLNLEKVFLIKEVVPEFSHYCEKAKTSMDSIIALLREHKIISGDDKLIE